MSRITCISRHFIRRRSAAMGVLISLAATAFAGCYSERCHDPPCPYYYSLNIKGQRVSDSADLFFGSHPVYPPDSIGFYSLLSGDSNELGYRRVPSYYLATDSIIVVDAYDLPTSVYMRLGTTDVDTFTIQYRILEVTECCGTTYVPAFVRYNGGAEMPWPVDVIDLRK